MATDTLAVFADPLKQFYGPNMARAISQKVYFLKDAEDKSQFIKWGGKSAIMEFPAHTKRSWSTGATSDGGSAATPRNPGFDKYQVGLPYLNGSFEISDRLIQITRSRPDLSYVGDALKFEMTELMLTCEKLLGIQIHGDGSGAIARVTTDVAAITGTTFRVDNPGTNWMEEGMFLVAHSNKTGTEADQFTNGPQEVVALDHSTNEVTVADTTGLANDDWIFLSGHYNVANMNGLYGIVDDGTRQPSFQGVTRTDSDASFSRAHIIDLDDASLTEAAMYQAAQELYLRAPSKGVGDWADRIITDPESFSWLALSVLDRQRFEGVKINAGFTEMDYHTPFGVKKVGIDALAWPHEMSWLRMADFFFGWLGGKGGHWFDEDGNILRAKPSSGSGTGYALAWVATWLMEVQFGCENPKNQLRLIGYTA